MNEAVAVERILPAQPIVEVNLHFHICRKDFRTLLSKDHGHFYPTKIGLSTNPSSLGSNGLLVQCTLHARSQATVEVRMIVTIRLVGWFSSALLVSLMRTFPVCDDEEHLNIAGMELRWTGWKVVPRSTV